MWHVSRRVACEPPCELPCRSCWIWSWCTYQHVSSRVSVVEEGLSWLHGPVMAARPCHGCMGHAMWHSWLQALGAPWHHHWVQHLLFDLLDKGLRTFCPQPFQNRRPQVLVSCLCLGSAAMIIDWCQVLHTLVHSQGHLFFRQTREQGMQH